MRAGLRLSCLVLGCGVLSSRRCHHAGSLVRGHDIGGVPGRPRQEACPERPPQEENWKIVVELNAWPGFSSVDGKLGWFGEFGKCWVSNV